MIVIVDYKMGNLGSIVNMCKKIGVPSIVSSRAEDIEKAEKIIFPGVGSFDNGMKNLTDSGLAEVVGRKVIELKTPILGICLGMQLMTQSSEEGIVAGFGWIHADVIKFVADACELRIPHMGWNLIEYKQNNLLFKNMYQDARFYFVHSYHVKCYQEEDIVTTTRYGSDFVSSFQKGNIFGVQFHPEKSHKFGMRLLKNFCEMVPDAENESNSLPTA